MDLTRCSRGHFYDAERFTECPYCNGSEAKDFTETVAYEEETDQDMMETTSKEDVKAKLIDVTLKDDQKTISYYNQMIGSEPVVGWLVCISGKHFGEDFRLSGGKNFIGRSTDMDVALTGEKSISRERHCIILYEPKQNIFMIQPGDSRELSYLNDKVILQAEQIKAYDVISLGDTKLMFIPFCGDQFKWEENDTKNE